jgi:hypothetical protein
MLGNAILRHENSAIVQILRRRERLVSRHNSVGAADAGERAECQEQHGPTSHNLESAAETCTEVGGDVAFTRELPSTLGGRFSPTLILESENCARP